MINSMLFESSEFFGISLIFYIYIYIYTKAARIARIARIARVVRIVHHCCGLGLGCADCYVLMVVSWSLVVPRVSVVHVVGWLLCCDYCEWCDFCDVRAWCAWCVRCAWRVCVWVVRGVVVVVFVMCAIGVRLWLWRLLFVL